MNDAIQRLAEATRKIGWALSLLSLAQARGDDRNVGTLLHEAEEDALSAASAIEDSVVYIRSLRAQSQASG